MDRLEIINSSLRQGNSGQTRKNVIQALDSGCDCRQIIESMLAVMEDVGRQFKNNELFVPEVLIIGRAFNVALDVMGPLLDAKQEYKGVVVIGTVQGDLHDIGKNLVKMLMVGTGAKVIDLGVDVKPEAFVEAIKAYQPDIVAMSALLTTTMIQIKQTIKAIEQAGLRDQVKIFVGGAPVTQHYAKNVGADYYALDAGSAAEIVRQVYRNKVVE